MRFNGYRFHGICYQSKHRFRTAILDQVVTSKALEELIRVVYDKFGAPIVDELDPMIRYR